MKRVYSGIVLLIFTSFLLHLLPGGIAIAEDEIPAGMEVKKVGDLRILVPEGAKVERTDKGGLIFVESTSEYTARKLREFEERISELESSLADGLEEIKRLKETVTGLEEGSLVSKGNE